MSKNWKKVVYSLICAITAVLYMVTILISYGSVSRNLKGWHGFSGGYAVLFVLICVLLMGGCIYNMVSIWKDKVPIYVYLLEGILLLAPLCFHFLSSIWKGNITTDLQYLAFRIFQGFENTYLFLILVTIVGLAVLLYQNNTKKE